MFPNLSESNQEVVASVQSRGGPWTDFEVAIIHAAKIMTGFADPSQRGLSVKKLIRPLAVDQLPEGYDEQDLKCLAASLISSVCIELLRQQPPEVIQRAQTQWQSYLADLTE
jgi:hypothetical protein